MACDSATRHTRCAHCKRDARFLCAPCARCRNPDAKFSSTCGSARVNFIEMRLAKRTCWAASSLSVLSMRCKWNLWMASCRHTRKVHSRMILLLSPCFHHLQPCVREGLDLRSPQHYVGFHFPTNLILTCRHSLVHNMLGLTGPFLRCCLSWW